MNVWIVAIDHELQLARGADDPMKIRRQKDQLEDLLNSPWWKSGYVRQKDGVIHRAAG
jgi:hypothetical protein